MQLQILCETVSRVKGKVTYRPVSQQVIFETLLFLETTWMQYVKRNF